MRQDHFIDMKYLHFNDNLQLDDTAKYSKIRSLFSHLNNLIRWNRKHLMLMKLWYLTMVNMVVNNLWRASQWSLNTPLGYCISFIPYQGKDTHIHPSLGLGGRVVYNLVSLLQKGPRYEIYFDNFFMSLSLLSKLTESGFGGTGTISLNRIEDCPLKSVPAMKKTAWGSYDYKLDSDNNIIVVRWNDNSIVTLASNITGVQPLQTDKRWDRVERKKIEITQPAMVKGYNKYMGGTDHMDRNVATYRSNVRSKKWWWCLF